jgi:hypothetical protein
MYLLNCLVLPVCNQKLGLRHIACLPHLLTRPDNLVPENNHWKDSTSTGRSERRNLRGQLECLALSLPFPFHSPSLLPHPSPTPLIPFPSLSFPLELLTESSPRLGRGGEQLLYVYIILVTHILEGMRKTERLTRKPWISLPERNYLCELWWACMAVMTIPKVLNIPKIYLKVGIPILSSIY